MNPTHYAKTPGRGVSLTSATPSEPLTLSPCRHLNGKGHHCSMFTTDPDSGLCSHHARKQVIRERKHTAAVAHSLLNGISDFSAPDCVNTFLANLLREVAHKRIDRRDAWVMAHIAQLLLQSNAATDRYLAAQEKEE